MQLLKLPKSPQYKNHKAFILWWEISRWRGLSSAYLKLFAICSFLIRTLTSSAKDSVQMQWLTCCKAFYETTEESCQSWYCWCRNQIEISSFLKIYTTFQAFFIQEKQSRSIAFKDYAYVSCKLVLNFPLLFFGCWSCLV